MMHRARVATVTMVAATVYASVHGSVDAAPRVARALEASTARSSPPGNWAPAAGGTHATDTADATAVVVDTDPTMYAPWGLDIDDDLAIALLLRSDRVRVVSVTATHGNSLGRWTCSASRHLLAALATGGLPHTVRAPGCGAGFGADYRDLSTRSNSAVRDIVDAVIAHAMAGAQSSMGDLGGDSSVADGGDDSERGGHPTGSASRGTATRIRRAAEICVERRQARATWLALGPVTNFAGVLYNHPEIVPCIDRLVIMGGDIEGKFALNLSIDRSAAAFVLSVGGVQKHLVTHNLCRSVMLTEADAQRWSDAACKGSWVAGHVDTVVGHARSFGRLRYFSPATWVAWLRRVVVDAWFLSAATQRDRHDDDKPGRASPSAKPLDGNGFARPYAPSQLSAASGFHPWDLVAAAYVTSPHLFATHTAEASSRGASESCFVVHHDGWALDAAPCSDDTANANLSGPNVAVVPTMVDEVALVDHVVDTLCGATPPRAPVAGMRAPPTGEPEL